jgi:hypothetical protein
MACRQHDLTPIEGTVAWGKCFGLGAEVPWQVCQNCHGYEQAFAGLGFKSWVL